MKDNKNDALRKHLMGHLDGEGAHISLSAALKDFPIGLADTRAPGLAHTAWSLVYHLRICQWDILEYSLNEGHESPEYPSGYWPKGTGPTSSGEWESTVQLFHKDIQTIKDMVGDHERDLDAPLRKGIDRSLLQMAILVIDHNSYHVGQFIDLRMLLGVPVKDW